MKIPENFDRWMFDYLEGNLSPNEVVEFEQFLALNPDFEVDADAWQNAVVESESIEYPHMQSLERKRNVAGWVNWSAAALLLLLISSGGFLLINKNVNNSNSESSLNTQNPVNFVSNQNEVSSVNSDNESSNNLFQNENKLKNSSKNNGEIRANNRRQNRNDFADLNSVSHNGGHFATTLNETNQTISNYTDANSTRGNSRKINTKSVDQEKAKFNEDENGAQYLANPDESHIEFDLSKRKNLPNMNSFSSVAKRIYRQLEDMMGYPVGIVNLRDQELLTPENNLLASNPGFAGGMLRSRLEMSYRNQWLGSDVNVQKSQISFDNYIPVIRGGFGIALNTDLYNNGAFADYSVNLMYSPKIMIAEKVVFEPGIRVTLGALTGNTSKIGSSSNIEMNRGLLISNSFETVINQTNKLWYKDYGLGFVLNADKFYVGFSADNLSGHYANIYSAEGSVEPTRSPVLLNGMAGYDFVSQRRAGNSISPFVSFRKYGELTEGWAGATVCLKKFTFGASYSTSQNYAASIGIKLPKFKLTYQYDQTTSLYTQSQMGSHNLGIRFTGLDKKSRIK